MLEEILIKNFFPSENTFEWDIERTASELEFQEIIANKLINLLLPITVELQYTINKENTIKKAATTLAAKFKATAIRTATEATAIAIEEVTTGNNNTNMEQHINKLIEAAIKKHTSNKQQKNAKGSKSPQTSLPKNNRQGKGKTKPGQHPPKHNPKAPPKNKTNSEKEKPSKQPEEPPNTKKANTKEIPQNRQKRKRQHNQNQNPDPQGGKKRDGRKGNGRKNKRQKLNKTTNSP